MRSDATQRYLRAKKIVFAALDLPKDTGETYIAKECAGDDALRREVDWLLIAADSVSPTDIPQSWRHMQQPPVIYEAPGTHVTAIAPGDYQILRRIGEGGMGVVYLAERIDGEIRQRVALKFLNVTGVSPILMRRFERERRILAGLSHSNIARMIDSGITADGRPFMALEYIEGEPIDRWCETRKLELDERIKLFLKICAAVAYTHQHLVIHRDLKPANILVDTDAEPQLLDFGIARMLEDSGTRLTVTGQHAFTFAYASPEQIEGRTLTTAVDVWALGVILYQLVCGVGPFDHLDTPHSSSNAILSGHITPPSRQGAKKASNAVGSDRPESFRDSGRRIPKDIDAIVLKALRRNPDERYASVTDLAEDLRRFLASRPVFARRGQRLYAASRFTKRHRFGIASVTVLFVLLTTAVLLRGQQLREVKTERDKAVAIAEFMNDVFKNADPFNTGGANVTASSLLQRSASAVQMRKDLAPAVKESMLLSIAQAYIGLHLPKDAVPLLFEAQRLLPPSAPVADRAAIMQQLGRAYAGTQDFRNAERADVQVLDWLRSSANASPRDVLTAQANLAVDRELLGTATPQQTIVQLQHLQQMLGRYPDPDAETLHQQLDQNIADAYIQNGNRLAATRMMREVVARAQRNFGPSDPRTLHDRWSLARALEDNRPRESMSLLKALLPDYARIDGTRTMPWAMMLNDLSIAQLNAGESDAAIATARQARAAAYEVVGNEGKNYLVLSCNLANTLHEQGRDEEAEAVLHAVLPTLRKQAGTDRIDHFYYAFALGALADIQYARRDYAQAGQNYAEAEAQLGDHGADFLSIYEGVLEGIVKVDIQTGDLDAASKTLIELQTAFTAAHLQPDSLDAVTVNSLRVRLDIAQRNYVDAAKLAQTSLEGVRSALACHIEVRELRKLQGEALSKLGLKDVGNRPIACQTSASH